jgi:3-hydroxyisobutyrate dehydrogenase-like beta-hydroxyacid dehydrogenase
MAGVGFIGLGIMGSRMAANVARAGFELTVWNRSVEKARRLAEDHGAHVADTPAGVASASDIVITMVVAGDDARAVLLGPDGAVTGARENTLFVDMSTIGPTAARRLAGDLSARGMRFLDAPVSGSSPKAEDGTLTIMAGGEADDFERARPVLDAMGELVVHVGPLGHGQMVKLLNNSLAAANTLAAAEALIAARAAEVDLDAFVHVVGAGSGASAMLALKAGPMREHDFAPLFKLEHMLKDVHLCLDETERSGVPFPSAAHAREVLAAAMGRGLGDQDFAALVEVVEGFAGTQL